jgi:hypothetical protein
LTHLVEIRASQLVPVRQRLAEGMMRIQQRGLSGDKRFRSNRHDDYFGHQLAEPMMMAVGESGV